MRPLRGVDSAVAAAIVHEAVGDRLTCIFVDHGLLRAGEAEQVEETFRRHFGVDLVHVKAADRFLEQLGGVDDPEVKRKRIGETFIRVRGGGCRPCRRPASSSRERCTPTSSSRARADAARIKSHHNVGGLPADMRFELIEPLRDLFKDEVRAVGEELGCQRRSYGASPSPARGWRSGWSAR